MTPVKRTMALISLFMLITMLSIVFAIPFAHAEENIDGTSAVNEVAPNMNPADTASEAAPSSDQSSFEETYVAPDEESYQEALEAVGGDESKLDYSTQASSSLARQSSVPLWMFFVAGGMLLLSGILLAVAFVLRRHSSYEDSVTDYHVYSEKRQK